jgi:hypothetical protein
MGFYLEIEYMTCSGIQYRQHDVFYDASWQWVYSFTSRANADRQSVKSYRGVSTANEATERECETVPQLCLLDV